MIVIYDGMEIDISKCDHDDNVTTIILSDESMLFIHDDSATERDLDIIQKIKEDIKNRKPPDPPNPVPPEPTQEQRLASLENAMLNLLQGGGV